MARVCLDLLSLFPGNKISVPSFPWGEEFQAAFTASACSMLLHLGLALTPQAEKPPRSPQPPPVGWLSP